MSGHSDIVKIYDTTCRDGTQAEDIVLSSQDKIRIARKLDDLGIHYIEGGWPGTSPRDDEFFSEIVNYSVTSARIAAFCSTVRPSRTPHEDPLLGALIQCRVPVATIFGKSWDIHVRQMLRVSPDADDFTNHLNQCVELLDFLGYPVIAARGRNQTV